MLTGGQVADCTAGAELLARMPACDILHGDKGYDSNALRRQIEDRGALPNIPPKANRKWKNCFSPFLYRNRNAIERMFCRLKDFRRVATRYDRSAVNFLAAVYIAATCGSAWNKDPAFGVIGVQSGPLWRRVHNGLLLEGGLVWDAGCGNDCKDPARLFSTQEVDQGDLPGPPCVAEGGAEGYPVRGDRVSL
jgi:transposase